MSLPLLLGTEAESIPAAAPYLRAPETGDGPPLPDDGRRKVGLVWASDYGDTYRRKILHATDLAPLFENEDCRFFGLQFGVQAAELDPFVSPNVVNLADRLGDFAQTAALVERMDVVIAIDTYIVHLAGALGKTAWVLLPYSPDWRWGLERDDTPWYPTIRLFRQARPGDWAGVVAAVGRALAKG